MAAVTICSDFGAKTAVFHRCPIFSSSSLSAIRVVSSVYLMLLIFLLAILIPACASSSPASLVAQRLKCLPAMWATWVRSLGQKDPLEKEMATHTSVLAWRIPGTGEPGGLWSMGSHRVGHNWSDLAASKELSCINDLTASLLPFSGGCPHPFSPSVCASLPCSSLNWTNCFFVCFPSCCNAVSNNKLCTYIYKKKKNHCLFFFFITAFSPNHVGWWHRNSVKR